MEQSSTYLQQLEKGLQEHHDLLETLKRKAACLSGAIDKWDENQAPVYNLTIDYLNAKIDLFDTNARISSLSAVINEKKNYFNQYAAHIKSDMDDMEKNYNRVYAEVNAKRGFIKGAAELLSSVNMQAVKENIEAKMEFYKRLKALLK